MFETFDDDIASYPFVGGLDLLSSHEPGHRDSAKKVAGMCCT
jgi:hypothetical protein